MFDMVFTGKRLAEARRQKDMSQMGLAERLGISFQAVSSWERGNAMPDIAKLPDIADILGVSVDYLLGGESKVADGVINGDLPEKVKAGEVSVDDIADVAPVMKPSELDNFAQKVADMAEISDETDGGAKLRISDMKQLLPFLGNEALGKLFESAKEMNDTDALHTLLPFLDEDVVDGCAKEICEEKGASAISAFLPFMSDDCVAEIAGKELEKSGVSAISCLLPFMDEDVIDKLAEKSFAKEGVAGIESVLPFMSDPALWAIAEKELAKNGLANIKILAPFMDDDSLNKLVMKLLRK